MSRSRLSLAALALAYLLLAPPGVAGAGDLGFNMQSYKVPTDPYGYITMDGARTLRQLQPFVAAGLNWASNPLTFRQPGEDLVEDLSSLDLVLGLGLFELGDAGGLELGVHVPIILDLNGVRLDDLERDLPSGGLGDIRADLKATIFDREEDLIGLYGRMYVDVPTGDDEHFLSDAGRVSLGWQVGVEKQLSRRFRLGVELGYEWLDGRSDIGSVTVDDKLLLNLGAGFMVVEDLWVVAEMWHWTRAGNPYKSSRESPVELGGAIRYEGFIYGMAGASAGLNNGVGAPDVRIFGMLGLTF